MPILESNYRMGVLECGDYSYFHKYEIETKDMTDHQRSLMSEKSIGGVDIKINYSCLDELSCLLIHKLCCFYIPPETFLSYPITASDSGLSSFLLLQTASGRQPFPSLAEQDYRFHTRGYLNNSIFP